ncbi:hypothetical protein [Novosphingobium sp. ST904]|uniref:hypothetical protein n=1 Tax=Novosphingobium sp. ST904 TaxID=1684385 RepID=UPI0006C8DD2E|nr:hypothetical protein [Novosphingobium sp. ST904]KPH58729.1 hypothetical protein ADT71_25785 [Novosphingobium sp. ST904]TCM42225.1 hypothetical protein EDF59_102188 [Novosphingobium sp. ST904]
MNQTKNLRNRLVALAAVPAVAIPVAAFAVQPIMYEESVARQEEALIFQNPIGGVQNSKWYDYRINVNESQKELASDLRHSTDIEDRRDAWEEYATELHSERGKYVKYMSKRGYRVPNVYFENL